jgi:UDP-N-acetylmuramoyl-L-alanyl-D-glutamate--2,6-diaminopimelate ligase
VIGTVAYHWGDHREPAPHTTPEASDLQRLLRRMREDGCDAAVLEVSSHALALGRLEGCDVDVGVFTNLTQDHLDFHGSMDRYFEAKARLFSDHLSRPPVKRPRWGVVNAEDPRANDLLARTRAGRSPTASARGEGERPEPADGAPRDPGGGRHRRAPSGFAPRSSAPTTCPISSPRRPWGSRWTYRPR